MSWLLRGMVLSFLGLNVWAVMELRKMRKLRSELRELRAQYEGLKVKVQVSLEDLELLCNTYDDYQYAMCQGRMSRDECSRNLEALINSMVSVQPAEAARA